MVDIVDKITRSRMMAGIRGKNTKPELGLRGALHRLGFRFRLHVARLPGRPDIVLPKHRAIIQVHGCFWHRHKDCALTTNPSSNIAFWRKKFRDSVARDKRSSEALQDLGWRVLIVWECALRNATADEAAGKARRWLISNRKYREIGSKPVSRRASSRGVNKPRTWSRQRIGKDKNK
jgi:DNA mismatch endonuclease (patch repair protein)